MKMKKISKFIAVLAAAVFSAGLFSVNTLALGGLTDKITQGDFVYFENNFDGMTVEKYNGKGGNVTIPDKVNGLPVNRIHRDAFRECGEVTSVKIPQTVFSIGENAFEDCVKLTSVNIPSNVTEIEPWTFQGCVSLEKIVIPEGVEEIEQMSFQKCSALKDITLPSTLESIGDDAFSGCTALENIKLPADTLEIGSSAFHGCTSLKSIVIPDGASVDQGAFSACSSLSAVIFSGKVREIEQETFSGCKKLTVVSIPADTEKIGYRAFSGCDSLKTVLIPDTVKEIGKDAFRKTDNVTVYGKKGSYAEKYAKDNSIPFKQAAAKPADIKTKAYDGKVYVSWQPVLGAEKYSVYYYKDGKLTKSTTVLGTSAYVHGLTNGKKYGFAVKAYADGKWTEVKMSDIVYDTPKK